MKALEVESTVKAPPLQLLSPMQGDRVTWDRVKSRVGHLYWAVQSW